MGNRMFQYAFGKILSFKKQELLYCPPLYVFKNIKEENINIPPGFNILYTRQFGDHFIDINILLNTKKSIVVNSFLQKIEYYKDSIDILRECFKIDNNIKVDENELVIHIRDGDYRMGNVHIRDQTYINILEKISPSKISIVTDNINTDFIKYMTKNGAKLITLSNDTNVGEGFNQHEMYDFLYMLNSNQLLISQSTYSWWAAFLGFQKKIYVPYDTKNKGMWEINPGSNDVDLIPPNDEKFIKVII